MISNTNSRIRFDESKKDQVFTRFDYNEIGYGIFNACNYKSNLKSVFIIFLTLKLD